MDLLKGNLNKIYLKYLFSALGSSIICSIYSTVDMVCVGQYAGPNGSAALSVVTPIWSVILSVGLLFGVGGSVCSGVARGRNDERESNSFFTVSLAASLIITVLFTILLNVFLEPMLLLFGADMELLPYCVEYGQCITFVTPAFLMGQVLVAFVRNDGNPNLALISVVSGGVINIFLDIYLVFTCDLGLFGAGLATAIGQVIAVIVLLTHFISKKCKLKVIRPSAPIKQLRKICLSGFSPFLVDISYGITVVLFNNRIMALAGGDELALYGTIANLHILVQALFYGVGNAVQPIASICYGAGDMKRVHNVLKKGLITAAIMGVIFSVLFALFPKAIVGFYIDATPKLLSMAPDVFLKFAAAFIFMGIGVVSGYYFQSVLSTGKSLLISLLRGILFIVIFIYLLPEIFGFDSIWLAVPLSEALTALIACIFLSGDLKKNKTSAVY